MRGQASKSRTSKAGVVNLGDSMTFLALSRTGFAVALAAAMALPSTSVQAQQADAIFSKVTPSFRERAFMRINYVSATVKTTSGDAYDVTGPVIPRNGLQNFLGSASGYPTANYMFNRGNGDAAGGTTSTLRLGASDYNTLNTIVEDALDLDVGECAALAAGLGTPCGVKARSAAKAGTMALSVGYFFDDELSWSVEALVLAAPLKVAIYGDGNNKINGQRILDAKLLPPTFILGKHFGSAKDRIRPFLGLGASYAFFYDVKATDTLNTFVGGRNSGDTTVKLTDSLGVGPFMGLRAQLDETWHLGFSLGKLRYKTQATLTTRNTTITSDSGVISAYPFAVTDAIQNGEELYSKVTVRGGTATVPAGYSAGQVVGTTTALMCDLARAKYGNTNCNQGTFVRKQNTVLDNTLLMLSVGRSF
jgi:outer membrane protein